jgi:hypothetical protein
MSITPAKKCLFCGIPIFGNHIKYCPDCSKFAFRIMNTRLSPEAIKGVRDYLHERGYCCYYSDMSLELTDPHKPFYCVFDHWIPGDPRKVVITSSLINNMKSQLLEEEFWYMIRQLANFKRKGIKVRKIKLKYWNRKYTVDPKEELCLKALLKLTTGSCTKNCDICRKKIDIYNSKYCLLCAKFVARLHSKGLPPETIEATLAYIRKYGFRCYYTGMLLELHDASSPWYYVCQFADFKEKHKKVQKIDLEYWYRLLPVDDVIIHDGLKKI